ncbi:hypothetical protein SAMN03159340_00641 [Sphingomonas sp. NFR15]|nr:hypothetical protein SAMN03159340_00641 [Sphingomonas sp. NFR15]
MGYLSAERAPWIGGMIRSGREIRTVFQHQTSYGAVIRLAFDGDDPDLTGLRMAPPQPPSEVEFWPDEEWPDE